MIWGRQLPTKYPRVGKTWHHVSITPSNYIPVTVWAPEAIDCRGQQGGRQYMGGQREGTAIYEGTSRGSSVHARRLPKIVDTQKWMAEAPKMFHYCTWKCSQSANKESNQWIFGSGEISRFDRGTEIFFEGGLLPDGQFSKSGGTGPWWGGSPRPPCLENPAPYTKVSLGYEIM